MAEGLSLFLNITAGDLASQVISKVVDRIKKMGDSSEEASKKLSQLSNNFKLFSASALALKQYGDYFIPAVMQSAELDKNLTRITLTTNEGSDAADKLRASVLSMSRETGQSIDNLVGGMNSLAASGLGTKEIIPTMTAINHAMAVSSASAEQLAGGLSVASAAFDFDLSKPGMAADLLDKMYTAGKEGNAELENLSDIFARVGVNAQRAGMDINQTLALTEQLSKIEKNPERLATLTDSTLRTFTNMNYMKAAQKGTGVSFYDKGERRDPIAVLADIQKKYKSKKSTESKDAFIGAAFGTADMDTIKGISALMMKDDGVTGLRALADKIKSSTGEVGKDIGRGLGNSVDQVARLKAELRNTMDEAGRGINSFLTPALKAVLDTKQKVAGSAGGGGLVLAGGAALLGLTALFGAKAGKNFFDLKGMAKTAAGLTAGKAIATAAGVTPVYVTNFGDMGNSGGAGPMNTLRAGGKVASAAEELASGARKLSLFTRGASLAQRLSLAPAIAQAGGAVPMVAGGLAAGAIGYGLGTVFNNAIDSTKWGAKMSDKISDAIAFVISKQFRDNARDAKNHTGAYAPKVEVATVITVDTTGNKLSEKTVTRQTASHQAKDM